MWVDPQSDVRLFGYPQRRGRVAWLELILLRGSVERMYSVWKGASGLETHCCRGLAKVRARALRPAMGLLELQRVSVEQVDRCGSGNGGAVGGSVSD